MNMTEAIARMLWPIKPPLRTRDPQKPMQILTLGLPRTGTDSLRTALVMLGYTNIWHGFEMPVSRSSESAYWTPLLQAKARGDSEFIRRFEWDIMLGDCQVMMDQPPVIFAEELLDYYPEAKVILNRRKDVDAWHKSLDKAIDQVFNPILWMLTWFDAELFWWYKTYVLSIKQLGGGRSFKEHGKAGAREYYARIERKLKDDGREFLDWEVGEGWGPLCEYLLETKPDGEFPWGNKGGEEFKKNADRALGNMITRAVIKFGLTVAVIIGVFSYGVKFL